jgi:uncharacterized repeat protein (TIGR01451 family)
MIAAALGATAASSLPAMAAGVDSATSPTGMVTVSVPTPVVAGTASTYTVTITNETSSPFIGPAGMELNSSMPAGVTITRISGCSSLGGNHSTSVLCSVPNLAAGASETATFSLVASAAGDYQIPFTAIGENTTLGGIGETATLPVTAQPAPTDIQVTGSSNNGSPAVGSTFTYTFQVKDNGPQAATGVTFDDTLPPAIPLGTTLATGQQSNITFSATPTATGSFGNTATIAQTGPDTNPANNSVTVTIQPR